MSSTGTGTEGKENRKREGKGIKGRKKERKRKIWET